MVNWMELEHWALSCIAGSSRMTESQRLRMAYLEELEASRKPLKARLGEAMVRMGARLDPHTVIVEEPADSLYEGRLAAYLR